MTRLAQIGILWSIAITFGWAQEVTTSKEENSSTPILPVAEPIFLPADSHALDLIFNADARQSDSVKQVVEALEKAGIATVKAPETTPLLATSIHVTLHMRKEESHEKIKHLIEALKNVGVQQITFIGNGAVIALGGKEQNVLTLQAHPGIATEELHRIQRAARTAAKHCGLALVMATRGLEAPENEEIFPSPERASGENHPLLEDENSTVPRLSGEAEPAREAPAGEIRVFALKNSQAAPTAELLMQLITVKPFRVVADAPHNSVVVIGSTEQLQAVEALLLKLDEPPREPIAEPKHDGKSVVGEDASKQIEQQVAQLIMAYETANKLAHELAMPLRKTPDTGKKPELRTAVQRAFTLRQSLLRAELREMQARLEKTQRSLDMRERIADQIVDRRVEDLLNPQLKWEEELSGELKTQAGLDAQLQQESSLDDKSDVVTELEGDWHLVAYIDKWQTERRPINLTIRASQEMATLWTGESVSRTIVVDENAKTIDFGSMKVRNGRPHEIVSERGIYKLTGDVLTIHSEYTSIDSVSGAVLNKGLHTNIWKRGLCEIPNDYDSRNPGNGMGYFYLNGNDENTGHGKLIPGNKVDVFVSMTPPNGTPFQIVLAENLEVDGSSEATQDSQRQMRLLGTREQCLLLQNSVKQETMSLRTRTPNDETLQFPNGINRDAFKELDAAASPNRDRESIAE
jgi:hypothetical protein